MAFRAKSTCLMLIDIWPQAEWNADRAEALRITRLNIARLVQLATSKGIPLWARNSFLPYPDDPPVLVDALRGSNLVFADDAFQPDGTLAQWESEPRTRVTNTVDYTTRKNLIYMGYRLDECVASMPSGYVDRSHTRRHNLYLVKDAGLVNGVCPPSLFVRYPGPHPRRDTVRYLLAESAFFCDAVASVLCESITTDECVRIMEG